MCVQVAALRRADPRPRTPIDCVQDHETEESGQGPTKWSRAIDE
jgi:hypothetical protein